MVSFNRFKLDVTETDSRVRTGRTGMSGGRLVNRKSYLKRAQLVENKLVRPD